jgi:hypothetical protein
MIKRNQWCLDKSNNTTVIGTGDNNPYLLPEKPTHICSVCDQISEHRKSYYKLKVCGKIGRILMLVADTDTDTDTDSNSALGDCLFRKFATWPHLTHCSSCCSGISSVLND